MAAVQIGSPVSTDGRALLLAPADRRLLIVAPGLDCPGPAIEGFRCGSNPAGSQPNVGGTAKVIDPCLEVVIKHVGDHDHARAHHRPESLNSRSLNCAMLPLPRITVSSMLRVASLPKPCLWARSDIAHWPDGDSYRIFIRSRSVRSDRTCHVRFNRAARWLSSVPWVSVNPLRSRHNPCGKFREAAEALKSPLRPPHPLNTCGGTVK